MTKYILRLVSSLIIIFISVPFIVSLSHPYTYSLPLDLQNTVSLQMPDGKLRFVSGEEYFSGAAAAYLPDEDSEEVLRAFCIILNTPELTAGGIHYLSYDERSQLFKEQCDEKSKLYSLVWESVCDRQLILPDDTVLPLAEYAYALEQSGGTYTEMLSVLFPGGGIKTYHSS